MYLRVATVVSDVNAGRLTYDRVAYHGNTPTPRWG
jgi:hypothetical protein